MQPNRYRGFQVGVTDQNSQVLPKAMPLPKQHDVGVDGMDQRHASAAYQTQVIPKCLGHSRDAKVQNISARRGRGSYSQQCRQEFAQLGQTEAGVGEFRVLRGKRAEL